MRRGGKTMRVSQNLLFSGAAGEEDPNLPPGESIAQKIEAGLRELPWTIVEPADLGDYSLWAIVCGRESAQIRITLAAPNHQVHDQWMLQIAPSYLPGLMGRLRHKTPSATPSDTYDLARAVHSILFAKGEFHSPKWCWDSFPGDVVSSPEPPGPDE
jgi:hypothetical protein